MDREHWKQIETLFDGAVALEGDARAQWLDEACNDPTLRAEVEALLAYAQRDLDPLADQISLAAAQAMDEIAGTDNEPQATGTGTIVGAYRLLKEIGRGGMSVVHLGERADGAYRQRVAIKIQQQGLGDQERATRFHVEREILAGLEHPNIARLLDGGSTDDGRPYLVMEYVEGSTVIDYCRSADLDLDARLELFNAICEAVNHAHQHLVVHRDLKPNNILVADAAEAGGAALASRVKLLDFGIAKLLAATELPSTPLTRTGVLLMTPQYAAPEQLRNLPVTTATDVYALGLLLFELITGQRPYTLEGLTPSEIETAVCEREPPRPSTLVTGMSGADNPATASDHQGPTAPAPSISIGTDLDAIVLKALAKEPERRYGSARELAEDLHRFRQGLAVSAREPTATYRLGKFLRRHWLASGAATAFLLLVSGFAATVTLQQQQTLRERDRAQLEAARSRAIADYMLSLFEAANPFQSGVGPQDVTAATLLNIGTGQVERLAGEPAVQAALLQMLSSAHVALGDVDEGDELLDRAATLQAKHAPADTRLHADIAFTRAEIAYLRSRWAESVGLRRDALAAYERLEGPTGERTLLTLAELADAMDQLGETEEAQALRDEIRARARTMEDSLDDRLAATLAAVQAESAIANEDFAAAEQYLLQAKAHLERAYGNSHPELAVTLNNLGRQVVLQGRFQEAEGYYRRALEIYREMFSPEHQLTQVARSNLAMAYARGGDYERAEPLMREGLEIRTRTLGRTHASTLVALGNLGILLARKGDTAGALEVSRDALDRTLSEYGEAHIRSISAMRVVVWHLLSLERSTEALPIAQRALELSREVLDADHPQMARALNWASQAERMSGDLDAAVSLAREALTISRANYGEVHSTVASEHLALGLALWAVGETDAARASLERSVAVYTEFSGADHPDLRKPKDYLARLNAGEMHPDR